MTKYCSKCHGAKPVEDFWRSHKGAEGRRKWCKNCDRAKNRKWTEGNYLRRRHLNLRRSFGIGLEEYTALSEKQGCVCKVCLKPETMVLKGRVAPLSVDHNHATKAIRGLLCFDCNRGIGLFDENPALLRAAAAYLEGASC